MRGTGHTDVPEVLQMPGNKADAVPCECLQKGDKYECNGILADDGKG